MWNNTERLDVKCRTAEKRTVTIMVSGTSNIVLITDPRYHRMKIGKKKMSFCKLSESSQEGSCPAKDAIQVIVADLWGRRHCLCRWCVLSLCHRHINSHRCFQGQTKSEWTLHGWWGPAPCCAASDSCLRWSIWGVRLHAQEMLRPNLRFFCS